MSLIVYVGVGLPFMIGIMDSSATAANVEILDHFHGRSLVKLVVLAVAIRYILLLRHILSFMII